ncbi:hypothetical protein [Aeromonas veronii]|uniref:hypothetical protein n=1 Tax=Aeromonas veronii TaxID=654 RepID=UPI0011175091|nr:hypothetical protein [Aeromonas veronii]
MMINESIYKEKKYVYINNNKEKLIIALNTHNQGDRYAFYNNLTATEESDYLFITDPNNGYYLDDDYGAVYKELIRDIALNYNKNRVCIIGSSMAGYAALHFGSFFGFHIIANNPQVDLDVTYKTSWQDLQYSLNKMPYRPHLRELINGKKPGNIFLIYGQHPMDISNVSAFDEMDFGDVTILKKKVCNTEHGRFFIKDLSNLFFIQNFLINLKGRY